MKEIKLYEGSYQYEVTSMDEMDTMESIIRQMNAKFSALVDFRCERRQGHEALWGGIYVDGAEVLRVQRTGDGVVEVRELENLKFISEWRKIQTY